MGRHRPLLFAVSSITALLLIAGCGDDDAAEGAGTQATTTGATPPAASPTPSPTSSESTTSEPGAQEIAVTIANGEITPAPDRVEVDEGASVRIVVRSDQHDEIHVHGYELSAEVEPGGMATIEFEADQTGLFEVESHELDTVLFQLQVQ